MSLPQLQPSRRGIGKLRRFSGGWMHQFGHIFCLQQEMLVPKHRSDWFRACELWHTARHEGLALNVEHYNVILRQIVDANAQWSLATDVLNQMLRDAVRPDAATVGMVLVSCANHAAWEAALCVFRSTCSKTKLRPNDMIFRALAVACATGDQWRAALSAVSSDPHMTECVATAMLEPLEKGGDDDALAFVRMVSRSRNGAKILLEMSTPLDSTRSP